MSTSPSPHDFLGRHVPLPELSGFSGRRHLESPISGIQAMADFVEGMGCFFMGADQKIAPSHQGIWQARYLEAAWWRLQDAASPHPVFPHPFPANTRALARSESGPGGVAVHLDHYTKSGRIFLRHMGFDFFRGKVEKREALDVPREEGWPVLPEDQHILGLPGVAEREKFWEPLDAYCIAQAMSEWDAVRFGRRKFVVEFLDHPQADPCPAFSQTFGAAAGAHLQAFLMQAWLPSPSSPSPATRL